MSCAAKAFGKPIENKLTNGENIIWYICQRRKMMNVKCVDLWFKLTGIYPLILDLCV